MTERNKRDFLAALNAITYSDNTEKEKFEKKVLDAMNDNPEVAEFLCDLKDNKGKDLFDDLDVVQIFGQMTWLVYNEPDRLKKVLSDQETIDRLSKSDRRCISLAFSSGMPSLEYCKTGSDATTSYHKWRAICENRMRSK